MTDKALISSSFMCILLAVFVFSSVVSVANKILINDVSLIRLINSLCHGRAYRK